MTRTLQHEIGKRMPFEHPEEEAFLNILRTAASLEGPMLRLFKQHGLSNSSYNVLRILRGAHPAGRRCGEISKDMVVRVPDVTRLIDRLVTADLVTRERAVDDRRSVLVRITRKGLRVLERLDDPVIGLHKEHLGHLSRGQLDDLNHLLVQVRTPATI